MPLGIDATIRYGLDIPGTESLRVSQLESDNPYNTRNRTGLPPTPIANPGLASMQAAAHPGEGQVPLLRAQARPGAPLLHGQRVRVLRQGLRVRLRLRLSGDLRHDKPCGAAARPKVGSLSPRMQNAAFAARALDVAYVPLGVAARAAEDAVRGLVALGFLGANVTTPHKRAVALLCDEVEGGVESVNTLVIRDGRVLGSSTDTEALGDRRPGSGRLSSERAAPQPRGSPSSRRAAPRCVCSPGRASGRRNVEDAELVVQATPVKDELLFRAATGADRDRSRVPRRGRRDGARRRRPRRRLRGRRRARRARLAGCGVVRALDRRARARRGHARRSTLSPREWRCDPRSPPPASRTARRSSRS